MSGFGYKQTSSRPKLTSALPPGTDISGESGIASRWPEATVIRMTRSRISGLCQLGYPAGVDAFQVLRPPFEVGACLYGEDLVGDVTNDPAGLI